VSCNLICYLLQGHVTISNDGATIMKLLDVVHPAAKTLVDVSLSQDAEVGSCRQQQAGRQSGRHTEQQQAGTAGRLQVVSLQQ
jgi:hypothetical protein